MHDVLMSLLGFFFFFNDTATTEIYTLSLHDALPISSSTAQGTRQAGRTSMSLWALAGILRVGERVVDRLLGRHRPALRLRRSEEHTSELQSRQYLVCRLLLEKKKNTDRSQSVT